MRAFTDVPDFKTSNELRSTLQAIMDEARRSAQADPIKVSLLAGRALAATRGLSAVRSGLPPMLQTQVTDIV
jgi:hypothetical protein